MLSGSSDFHWFDGCQIDNILPKCLQCSVDYDVPCDVRSEFGIHIDKLFNESRQCLASTVFECILAYHATMHYMLI